MKAVSTDNAPAAIGPYSQAIIANGFLFCSGQLGIDPATAKLCADDTAGQAACILKNISSILAAVDSDLNAVVKTTIFLTSLDDFKIVNDIYAAAFGSHKPARSTVQVSRLPLGAKIEIECIAEIRG
jgi:2-iminobutanoate/2-iminopropanoate deaminase